MSKISTSREVALTPALIADMEMDAFMKTCVGANVSIVKIIADLCELAQVQLNVVYEKTHDLTMTYYDGRNTSQEGEEFSSLIQNLTSLGAKMGELQSKRQVALFYFDFKTPDCFKNKEVVQ